MNLKLSRTISTFAIILIILGSFGNPMAANAGFFDDILGKFGIGGGSNSNREQSSTGEQDGTIGESTGDIELTKEARRIGRDKKYHDKIQVRSGELVEVRIEVINRSRQDTTAVVRDELGGSVVYVKNSLRVNGQTSQGSLTSGGLQIKVPAKTTVTIFYQFNVCGASGHVTRASAYAPIIGSAIDGLLIEMENQSNSVYFDEVSTCMSQLQNTGNTNANGSTFTNSNPFGTWTGVNNANMTNNTTTSNPFAGWTGVDNSKVTSHANSSNHFAGWTGVNNANAPANTSNNAFGTWTGVNNLTDAGSGNSTANSTPSNPFNGWTGVDNASASTSTSNNPFTGWTGVSNASTSITTTNPFNGWTGVDNAKPVTNNSGDVFGTWTGVNSSAAVNNPFGDWGGNSTNNNATNTNNGSGTFGTWTGVNTSSQTNNPFGDWTGTTGNSNGTAFDARGYSSSVGSMSSDSATTTSTGEASNRPMGSTVAYEFGSSSTPTSFIAPTTGVNPLAPFGFAGLLTAGYLAFRNRKFLFN